MEKECGMRTTVAFWMGVDRQISEVEASPSSNPKPFTTFRGQHQHFELCPDW